MKDSELLPYMAGLFDGEGSIHLSNKARNATIVVTFTNTNLLLCQIFAAAWGGHISSAQPKNKNARRIYRWYRFGKTAVPFLKVIFSYSIGKKELAELAIQYIEAGVGSGRSFSNAQIQRRQQLAEAIFNHQHKGHKPS